MGAIPDTTDEIIAAAVAQVVTPYQTTSTHLGPSKISTYQKCAAAYRWQYIDKVPTPSSPAATVGTAFHFVAEQIRPNKWTAEDAGKAADLLLRVWQELRGLTTDPDDVDANNSINDACLEWLPWYLWYSGKGTDIDSESRWVWELTEAVTLQGTIDRLYIHDGAVVISDLKTGKRAPVAADLKRDLQASLYWGAMRQEGLEPSRFEQVMPRKREAYPTTRTDEYLQAVIENIVLPVAAQIANATETGHWPCNPNPLYGCNFCNYQSLCAVGRGSGGES